MTKILAPKPSTNHRPLDRTRWKIAQLALVSRIIVLMAMSISCSLFPDFRPGDDVLQYDLRLSAPPSSSAEGGGGHCFCLQGYGCDPDWKSRRRAAGDYSSCADESGRRESYDAARFDWLDRVYAFVLPPVTKWDAARFLTLSVDPWARHPPPIHETCRNSNDNAVCDVQPHEEDVGGRRFHESEQAHAFLPLFPLAIRYTTKLLMKTIPFCILPPTYEATACLSAIAVNMLAFVIAAISLYDLTTFLLKRESLENSSNATTDGDHSKQRLQNETSHRLLAQTAAELFCINPAGVFFTAAYSESVFAMLTFTGHAMAARGQYYRCQRQRVDIDAEDMPKRCCGSWCYENVYWVASTVLWMLASYTRSNGTFSSIWLLLVCISNCSHFIAINHREKERKRTARIANKCLSLLLYYCLLAMLVAYPVCYHDQRGYNFHCVEPMQNSVSLPQHTPAWCNRNGTVDGNFLLYAHVQRKHWNVGLFRYYEMKQVPNFILALPVLVLSFASAASWIGRSWNRHMHQPIGTNGEGRLEGVFGVIKGVIRWSFLALGASSCDCYSSQQQRKETNGHLLNSDMLHGPKFLSYYAILAGFALVGTFLVHVQISTRLICSSCPAFYWFVSSLVTPFFVTGQDSNGKKMFSGDARVFGFTPRMPFTIYCYFALYNVLGFVMHVNWLPWT